MVKPSVDTVREAIGGIKEGQIVTLEVLRAHLAKKFGVATACPAATAKVISILSKEDTPISYWRVVKKNGELLKNIPGGAEAHGFLLAKEGHEIDTRKKSPRLMDFDSKMANLD